jgi:uncharacterized membrane protein
MSKRHEPFDVLRGLVIVLMALDHTRGFIQPEGANPTDWSATTMPFFLVRWVTHLCAPSFVFLMGVGAYLRHQKRGNESTSFLFKRGIWLIFLEMTWISFCWTWDPTQTYLGVLWALGGSMVILSALVRIPARWVTAIGLGIIIGLEGLAIQPPNGFIRILFQPGSMEVFGHSIGSAYALLPWFGVAALGWGLAPWLIRASSRALGAAGASLLLFFTAYRSLQWTDPNPWESQSSLAMTAADFLQPSKYPPSVCFLLLTLGIAALVLARPARGTGTIVQKLTLLGRVPMFFYLLHLPLAHALANAWAWLMYNTARVPNTEAVSVPTILIACTLVVVLLWPLCVRWDSFKRQRRDLWWVHYL